jgi:hypothetical protein
VVMEAWRAGGVHVQVIGGVRNELSIDITILEYETGFDVGESASTIEASIITRSNRLSVGQGLTIDSIKAAAIFPYATAITKVRIDAIRSTVANVTTNLNVTADVEALGTLLRVTSVNVADGKAPGPGPPMSKS